LFFRSNLHHFSFPYTLLTIISLELRLQFHIHSKTNKDKEGKERNEHEWEVVLKSIMPITPITPRLPTDLSRALAPFLDGFAKPYYSCFVTAATLGESKI
jgi:hypothetical protein